MSSDYRHSIQQLPIARPDSGLARRIRRGINRTSFATLLLMLFGSLLLTGCGPLQIRAGKEPDITALERSLRSGHSTQRDVVAALGVPSGKGRAMFPWQTSPRTLWSYYYEEGLVDLGGSGSDDRRIFLFVFFDGDKYDGYMWFSSLTPAK